MPWESIPRLSDSMSTCQRGKEREHSTIQRWKVGCNPRNREQECEREHTVQPFVRPCSPKIQTLWAGEVPPAAHERGWPTNNRGQGHTAALLPDPSYPPPPPSFSLHSSRPRPRSGAPPTHLGSCHSLLVRHAILHKYVLHKALEEVKVHPSVRHGRGGGLGLGTRRRRRRLHPVHRRPHRHHRVIGGPTCSRPAGHQARVLLFGRRRRRAAAGQDRGRRRTERRERVLAGRRHRGHGRGGGGGGRHGRKKRVGRERSERRRDRGAMAKLCAEVGTARQEHNDGTRGKPRRGGSPQQRAPGRGCHARGEVDQGRAVVTGGTRGGRGHNYAL